jgi:hypothetical protein
MAMADPKYGPTQLLQDEGTVADFFGKAPAMYNEKGIASTVAVIEDLRWVTPEIGIVQARFPYLDADGNDIGNAETSIYTIRRNEAGDLAIICAVALGTDEDLEARRRGKKHFGEVGDQRS